MICKVVVVVLFVLFLLLVPVTAWFASRRYLRCLLLLSWLLAFFFFSCCAKDKAKTEGIKKSQGRAKLRDRLWHFPPKPLFLVLSFCFVCCLVLGLHT